MKNEMENECKKIFNKLKNKNMKIDLKKLYELFIEYCDESEMNVDNWNDKKREDVFDILYYILEIYD